MNRYILGLRVLALLLIGVAASLTSSPVRAATGPCGLSQAAFCDTFTEGPQSGRRADQLDSSRWSVSGLGLEIPGEILNGSNAQVLVQRVADGSAPSVPADYQAGDQVFSLSRMALAYWNGQTWIPLPDLQSLHVPRIRCASVSEKAGPGLGHHRVRQRRRRFSEGGRIVAGGRDCTTTTC